MGETKRWNVEMHERRGFCFFAASIVLGLKQLRFDVRQSHKGFVLFFFSFERRFVFIHIPS